MSIDRKRSIGYASPKRNKFCSIKTACNIHQNITRNALCQAKTGQSCQHTDSRRI